nr:hypothetical protein [Apilactobacillus micheneri]
MIPKISQNIKICGKQEIKCLSKDIWYIYNPKINGNKSLELKLAGKYLPKDFLIALKTRDIIKIKID